MYLRRTSVEDTQPFALWADERNSVSARETCCENVDTCTWRMYTRAAHNVKISQQAYWVKRMWTKVIPDRVWQCVADNKETMWSFLQVFRLCCVCRTLAMLRDRRVLRFCKHRIVWTTCSKQPSWKTSCLPYIMAGNPFETHSLAWGFYLRGSPMSRTTSFYRFLIECGRGADGWNVIVGSTGAGRGSVEMGCISTELYKHRNINQRHEGLRLVDYSDTRGVSLHEQVLHINTSFNIYLCTSILQTKYIGTQTYSSHYINNLVSYDRKLLWVGAVTP